MASANFSKFFVYALIVSMAGLLLVGSANAETVETAPPASNIPVPSVPQFIVMFFEMGFSPMTGGDKVPVINFTFKSQPFTSYTDKNANKINLYYLIDWKRPSDNSWIEYPISLSSNTSNYFQQLEGTTYMITTFSIYWNDPVILSQGGPVEFKVAALIGYQTPGTPSIIGETSGWTGTQTIIVPVSSSSPTPIANGSLALTLAISIIVAIIALVITLLIYRRHRKTANVPKVI